MGLLGRLVSTLAPERHPAPPAAALEALRTRFDTLLRRDLDNVDRGIYPRALLDELNVAESIAAVPLVMADLPRTLARIRRRDHEDLPAGVDRDRYPHYYLRNFHWQTDGWVSDTKTGNRVAVEPNGCPWVVTGSGAVWRRGTTGQWTKLRDPGSAYDGGVGASGHVFVGRRVVQGSGDNL